MAVEKDKIFLKAENLSLLFPSGVKATPGLKLGWRKLLGANIPDIEVKPKYSIKDISIELKAGDRLALSGSNGSGKTTLLKLLSGGLPPTSGTVEYHGRLMNMLNPSVGINPEATGYENILLKGLYLNQSLKEMRDIAEEIIEFSELGDAIYQPVRTYSAGMKARLSFSVVVFSKPDILLLDEWLGVGDKNFQQKAADKMRDFVESSSITVLATHNERLKSMICNRELILKNGRVIEEK
jgi:ABC-type polysaccharide/polyol phosphate transport system ATPase subunit